jgi:YD repeat-containing protein
LPAECGLKAPHCFEPAPSHLWASLRERCSAGWVAFAYDLDGNLTGDGLWSYTYDAENRLVAMTTTTAAITAGYPARTLEFTYDYLGRRVQKQVTDLDTSITQTRRFVYDGWNLVAKLAGDGTGASPE